MPRSLTDLAASIDGAARSVEPGQRKALNASSLFVTREIRTGIRRDTGGDSRMSGVGSKGARVGAKYAVRGDKAYITATGPIHLLERDTSPRTIPKKRRRRAKVLKIGGNFRRRVEHPGTKGKHTFERTWKRAAPESVNIYGRELSRAIERGWRG
jgi:hypothetical protein